MNAELPSECSFMITIFIIDHYVTALTFNSAGAFVGTTSCIPSPDLPLEELAESDDRSLVYDTFLVVPLLSTGGFFEERKFSGNSQIGRNDSDFAGIMVDAFAHHVLDYTNGSYMLADLQGTFWHSF